MKHKRPPKPVIAMIILTLGLGGYFGIKELTSNGNSALTVSGTIEATEISISPEMAGKVVEVFVEEGSTVQQGDLLFRMDDSLLQTQRQVAASSLETAKAASSTAAAAREVARANYNLALDAARQENSAARTQDWSAPLVPGYTLPAGYFSQQELISAARQEVSSSSQLMEEAEKTFNKLTTDPVNADFIAAEQNLLASRSALQTAQELLARARLSSNLDLQNDAQDLYDTVRSDLDSAQLAYDALKNNESSREIISARLQLVVLQEQYETAQDRLLKLLVGENAPKVRVAKAVLDQAELAVSQTQAAIQQAEAQLALVDLQIEKTRILAPSAGVILTRSIEPGEMVSAAALALKLGQLDNLSITVYVPEDIYGILSLGQKATLTVDSFPGETFSAIILNIADQAEFTPRNVQTVEGRKATVFAIQLKIEDSSGSLKPGMPADVNFEN
jgi:HlyD family secretion protein